MTEIEDHHYVPRYYLRGFTNPPMSNLLWVYEKGSRRTFQTGVSRIGYENHFYTFTEDDGTRNTTSVESFLTYNIENPANPILRKLREKQMITQEEKRIMSNYIAVMMMRVPRNMERMQQLTPGVKETLAATIDQEVADAMSKNPDNKETLGNFLAVTKSILDEYSEGLPKKAYLQFINTRFASVIYHMTWQFFTSEGGPSFLTNDNPVFFDEGIGIANEHSEISFPISSTVGLWASWRNDVSEGFVRANNQMIKELNNRTISNATRFVFYPFKADWLVAMLNKPVPRLRRII